VAVCRYFDDIFDMLGLSPLLSIAWEHIKPVICSDRFDIFSASTNYLAGA